MSHARRRILATGVAVLTGISGLTLAPPEAQGAPAPAVATAAKKAPGADHYTKKTSLSTGFGGAVTSVDPEASRIGIQVLRRGGNAVDAAVATAAALGVTEPYSSGIGGGGYFVHYNARTGRVSTLDGRETAPRSMPRNAFVDPKTGKPYNFTPELVTSGVAVGTPGTLATWRTALRKWGRKSLAKALRPATRLARRGFVVDKTFNEQTADNQSRFANFPATRRLFLPGGKPPAVGSVFRNRDLARTYGLIARRGTKVFYQGRLGRQVARTAQHPPKRKNANLPVPKGFLKSRDLARYRVKQQAPTHVAYRGYDVYGMAPSSSGGTTVGEALNILERFGIKGMSNAAALHHYLEASALAYADRAKYLGDPAYVKVPTRDLLSDPFAAERACEIDPAHAATKPVPAGNAASYDGRCATTTTAGRTAPDTENINTTNLTVTDRWGNVVEYTLTIEQTGGSGITVPGRGFLLNNELTDFTAAYDAKDPNRIQPGKRPRSSIAPTIVLRNGEPFLALGSPGGSTIITTVLQILFNRIDRGMSIQAALEAPRAQQSNAATVNAEPEFISAYGAQLQPYGHVLKAAGDQFTSKSEIGAATAIEFGPGSKLTAVSEHRRRGGGSALVVRK